MYEMREKETRERREEMKKKEMQKALLEMMNEFNRTRALWIEKFGSDAGFGDWFSSQIMKGKES